MSQAKITEADIDAIMEKTHFHEESFGNKTTIVIATLPNGFVIVESSSCVDPANFKQAFGVEICKKRIRDKIWQLEGYWLQTILAAKNELIDNVKLSSVH